MSRYFLSCILALLFSFPAASEALTSSWLVAKNPHFEVYVHADSKSASELLRQFEQLRAFFSSNHLFPEAAAQASDRPLRVIAFHSTREYEEFKIRATADAYFVNISDRNYIVLPDPRLGHLGIAAHEYAHFVLHSAGMRLPAWLSEGIAEVLSTLTISNRECHLGGMIPAHFAELHSRAWLPLADLSMPDSRQSANLFYAESWALADTLMEDAAYAPHFDQLMRALQEDGSSFELAFAKVYHNTSQSLLISAHARLSQRETQLRRLPGLPPPVVSNEGGDSLSEFESSAMLADLLFANGELDRAEQRYKTMLRQSPQNADILAALGAIALKHGDQQRAFAYWQDALDAHVSDANLCYRYAVLLDEANGASSEIRRALDAAIYLNPHFDEARWRLGLLLNNEGDFMGSLTQLEAMSPPKAERAYAYWMAKAYALSQLDRRSDAIDAAGQASNYARNAGERKRADEISYEAKTELAVRFTRDAEGNLKLSTTRVPVGTTDFNPFVEPEDHINVVTGNLTEVQCHAGRLTGLVLESKGTLLKLAVPDPFHVLMRNGPSQFNCGAQLVPGVTVEYAATAKREEGILRAMKF